MIRSRLRGLSFPTSTSSSRRSAHTPKRDPYDLAVHLQALEVVLGAGDDIEVTLPEVMAEADEVLVIGSLYLAGAVRDLVRDGVLDEPYDDEDEAHGVGEPEV